MNKKTKIIRVILLSISLILLLNMAACSKKKDSGDSDSKTTDSQADADNNNEETKDEETKDEETKDEETKDVKDEDSKDANSDQLPADNKQANKNVNDTSTDLMADVKAQEIQPDSDMQKADFMQKFSVEMLQNLTKDSEKNILFSPLSIYYALGMTHNAAANNTLQQMTDVLHSDPATLNQYLFSYDSLLKQQDETVKLNLANSIWFNADEADTIQVKPEFLQTNADYYNAALRELAFDDNAKDIINSWVNENTKEMIPEIIDEIPEEAIMYLINALAFEGEWQVKYEEEDIEKENFYPDENTYQEVQMMKSEENYYLADEYVQGFLKPYKNPRYVFMALLPNYDVKLSDYIANLDADSFSKLLDSVSEEPVLAGIPQFKTECSFELSEKFKNLGMTDAFDPNYSDFSNGFESVNPIVINRILHKTFLEVDAEGTKAAAVTAVEMEKCSMEIPEEKTVYLTSPFLYFIIDTELQVPIFVGQMLKIDDVEVMTFEHK
ncbi:MAG: serpin family protein [Saccharofermentanales bacterium]